MIFVHGNSMLLEYNDNVVDYFEKLFPYCEENNKKKIGIWVSGGADSAFCLWYLSKCIVENNLEGYTILPVHGWDTARKANSGDVAKKVINIVKEDWPTAPILDPYIFEYYKDPDNDDKGKYHDPHKVKLIKGKSINFIINSLTGNPPTGMMLEEREDHYQNFINDKATGKHPEHKTWFEMHLPFARVNKKFLAHLYHKYNLMELFTVTVSCTGDIIDENFPCGKCYWCQEKYWAFNMIDGGVVPRHLRKWVEDEVYK